MHDALKSQYIHLAALSAIVWDILIHTAEDSKFMFESSLSLANIAFLLSRVSAIGQAFAAVLFSFTAGTNAQCQSILTTAISLFVVSGSLTSLLFIFRARAVFFGGRRATVFFAISWIIVIGNCAAQPAFLTAQKSPSGACTIESMPTSCMLCLVTAAANDIIVFSMISWKILTFFAAEEGLKCCFAYFCGRDGLPTISHVILRTGQQYFLIGVTLKLLGTVLVYHSVIIPVPVRFSLFTMLMTLENAMGCKVFRDIKLDLSTGIGTLSNIPRMSIQFAQGSQPSRNLTSIEQSE